MSGADVAVRVRVSWAWPVDAEGPAAQVVVESSDGRELVDMVVPALDVARLLAGEPVAVSGWAAPAVVALLADGGDVDDVGEDDRRGRDDGGDGDGDGDGDADDADPADRRADDGDPVVGDADDARGDEVAVRPEPGPDGYGAWPPAASVAIESGLDVEVDEDVVAFARERWRDAVVISRDRRSLVVGYVVSGEPFGRRHTRLDVPKVRRWRG